MRINSLKKRKQRKRKGEKKKEKEITPNAMYVILIKFREVEKDNESQIPTYIFIWIMPRLQTLVSRRALTELQIPQASSPRPQSLERCDFYL